MSWDWLRLESKFDGLEPPARATLFTVAGTWAHPHMGFQADLARAVGDERWRWEGVQYSASFGPIAGQGPSYADSVQEGRRKTGERIAATPGKFALSGYSQGGEVVGWVCIDLIQGALQHRRDDCLGVITFGDPARQKTDLTFGGGGGWGISRLNIPPGIRRVTYAAPGDLYCCTPDTQAGDNQHAMYQALTRLGSRPEDVLQAILSGDDTLLEQLQELLANPALGIFGIIQSLIALAQLGAHGAYGQWIGHAAAQLDSFVPVS